MLSDATWRLVEAAWDTPSHATWEAAYLSMFRERWGTHPLDENSGTMAFARALLALGWAGFDTQRVAAERYVMGGWAVAGGPHPPYLQRTLNVAVADLVATSERAPPATPEGRTLQSMLIQFSIIEGIVLPHLGLMCAMAALANAETPDSEDIMLEPTRLRKQPSGALANPVDARRLRKLRSLSGFATLFKGRLAQLRKDPRTADHMDEIIAFARSLEAPENLDFSRTEVLPLENVRHGVGHFDLYLHADGDVSFGWNLFTRSGEGATRLVPFQEILETQRVLVGLTLTLSSWSDFLSAMASGRPSDWAEILPGLTDPRDASP